MASFLYQKGVTESLKSEDLIAGTIKVLLVTSGYTPNKDHDFVSDLVPGTNELSGFGYERKTLTNKTLTEDDANDRAVFDDGDDVTWTAIDAGTAAAAVLFIQKTNDADSILLAYIDSGGFPFTTNGGDLVIEWNAAGIFYISC